jgi:hypothetical protein
MFILCNHICKDSSINESFESKLFYNEVTGQQSANQYVFIVLGLHARPWKYGGEKTQREA